MLFSVKNLSFTFHNFALKDISFTLKKGEILGIIGESGSGKTLLSLRILGLLENVCDEKGEIIFNQNRIESMQKFLGKEITYIPQEPLVALNPLHKIKKQVVEILALHNPKMPKFALESRFAELMQMVDLDLKFSEVYPYELSGGQRQRVLMAIALANNPKIIIADEPTTALDSVLQKQILDLLRELSQRLEIAVILITHNIAVVRQYADKIILLKNGEMVGNLFWGMQFAPFSHKTALDERPSSISLVSRKNGAKPHRHYFDCDSQRESATNQTQIAESTPDSAKSQNLVKNNPCEAPENSPASWCKKSGEASSSGKADFLLEAEKRGSPPKSEKAAAFWEHNKKELGGAGRGVQPFLRKKTRELNKQKSDDFAESRLDSANFCKVDCHENPTDFLAMTGNSYFKELLDATHFSYHNPNLSDEILLEVRDLSVFHTQKKRLFGKNTIKKTLHNVNFALKKGEILGIIGESGSGKSTLALALLKLIAYSGDIAFKNQNYQNIPNFRAFRKNIQIVFQDPNSSINPRFRIKDIIKEGLNIHFKNERDKDKKVAEILRFVGLDESKLPCFPRELSGGQRQRVAIARALILNPQILILDEPTSALDKITQKQVLSLLLRLKDEFGLSYILITHDLGIISALCDNIIVLKDGEIVEKGDRFMLQSPQNPYTKSLVESIL